MVLFSVYYNRNPDWFGTETYTLEDLEETHGFVCDIIAESKDDAFTQMQAHIWQPDKEDIDWLKGQDVHHASMSVSDILMDTETKEAWKVMPMGWEQVK